jgi:hypothetical protein
MSSHERRNFDKQRKEQLPTPPPPRPPDSAIIKSFKKFWWLIGIILVLGGGLANYTKLADYFKSGKRKYDEAKGPLGVLKMPLSKSKDSTGELSKPLISTPPIDTSLLSLPKHLPPGFKLIKDGEAFKGIHIPGLSQKTMFVFELSNSPTMIEIGTLYKGLNIFGHFVPYRRNDSFYIKAINDSVYISATFTDLETENAIATVDFNRWHVIAANSLSYYPTDTSLEVRDNRNCIALSIIYFKGTGSPKDYGKLKINGYFIDDKSILVSGSPDVNITDSILKTDKDWKEKAKVEIQKIPSIFPSGPIQTRD